MWRHKKGIVAWCAMLVIRTPLYAFRAVKELPNIITSLVKWLGKATKVAPEKIGRAAGILGTWLRKAIKGLS